MVKGVLITGLIVCAWSVLAAEPEPKLKVDAKDHAVVLVGISDYSRAGLESLDSPERDVCALLKMYRDTLKVPRSNIHVFIAPSQFSDSSDCKREAASPATLEDMLSRLDELTRAPKRVVMHFSGHGVENEGQQELLIPKTGRDDAHAGLERKGVPLAELAHALTKRSGSTTQLFVFVDACRELLVTPSNPTTSRSRALLLGDMPAGVAGAIFLAAAPGKKSYSRSHNVGDAPSRPIGLFTWSTIKGLLGGGTEDHDFITPDSLFEYLKTDVPRLSKTEFTAVREAQNPTYQIFGRPDVGSIPLLGLLPFERRVAVHAEVFTVPLDAKGKQSSAGYSFDVVASNVSPARSELLALGLSPDRLPGPYSVKIPAPQSILAEKPTWQFLARVTIYFGINRYEYVLCDKAPEYPNPPDWSSKRITARIEEGTFHLVVKSELDRYMAAIHRAGLMVDDPGKPPEVTQRINSGCVL